MISKNDWLAAPAKPAARTRNMLDTLFYDVDALSQAERAEVMNFRDHEGAIVVVPPAHAGEPIRYYERTTDLLAAERRRIGGVAVAGVGSSILGTAALARNVADAYRIDVAGIVSGYGATDLAMEAFGGWFFYGYTDKLRHYLEIMLEQAAITMPAPLPGATETGIAALCDARQSTLPRELDSGTLFDILMAAPANLEIVVGHSKGAMLIDFVLEQFVRRMRGQPHRYYDDLRVVTVGAVVGLSYRFRRTSQIIGALDWFGAFNSLPDLLAGLASATSPKYIPHAWHHLSDWPFRLGLVDALSTHVRLH